MFKKPVLDDLSLVTWYIILLEVAISRSYKRGGHCPQQYLICCSIGKKGPQVCQENTPHTITPPAA